MPHHLRGFFLLVNSFFLPPRGEGGEEGGGGGRRRRIGGRDEEGSFFSSACFVQGRESSAFLQMRAGGAICEGRTRPRGAGARLCCALVTKR